MTRRGAMRLGSIGGACAIAASLMPVELFAWMTFGSNQTHSDGMLAVLVFSLIYTPSLIIALLPGALSEWRAQNVELVAALAFLPSIAGFGWLCLKR